MSADDALTALLLSLETALQRQDVRASAEQLDALIDDDFYELGVSGAIWTKAAVIAALKDEAFSERLVSDFQVKLLADDVALVTYRGHRVATAARPAADSLRSSIWRRRDGAWRMMFHQGTAL